MKGFIVIATLGHIENIHQKITLKEWVKNTLSLELSSFLRFKNIYGEIN